MGAQQLAELGQQGIAAGMAVQVVERLEVVQVEHHHAHRQAATLAAGQFAHQRLFQIAAVEQAGERVADGLDAQAILQGKIVQGHRQLLGHGPHHVQLRQERRKRRGNIDEAQLDTLQPDDILILAGSIPKSLSQSTYERLLAGLEGHGVRAVVDATQDLLVNVLPYHPFLIKPNDHELGEIVGRELKTDAEITAAARALQEKGARNVLVSMAGNGALLVDEHGEVHRIGCPKGKVVNSVGAGDSMVAGFVAGYLQSGSYEQALRLGTACGSATAFSLGLATKEKIAELMQEI